MTATVGLSFIGHVGLGPAERAALSVFAIRMAGAALGAGLAVMAQTRLGIPTHIVARTG